MRTANPVLKTDVFKNSSAKSSHETMTIQGTVNKSFILLILLTLSAGTIWQLGAKNPTAVFPFLGIGVIGGLIVALITMFKPHVAPITTPIYAILEGMFVGGLSMVMEMQYPGIVMQAVTLTFGTLFGLLTAYKTGLIKVSEQFKLGLISATGGIALVYFVSFILSLFRVPLPFMYGNGVFSILFSLVVVVIAALNLVLDFDFIEKGSQSNAPKYMEWYGAFGLMVTLIWLYIELLRLIAKFRSRD